MSCNYYGKIIPGGDRASCVAGGGTWVEDAPHQLDSGLGGLLSPQPASTTREFVVPNNSGTIAPITEEPSSKVMPNNIMDDSLFYEPPGETNSNVASKQPTGWFEEQYNNIFDPIKKQRREYTEQARARIAAEEAARKAEENETIFYKGVETRVSDLPPGAQAIHWAKKNFPGVVSGLETVGDTVIPDFIMESDIAKQRGQDFLERPWSTALETAADALVFGYWPAKGMLWLGGKVFKVLKTGKGFAVTAYGTTKYFTNKEEIDAWVASQKEKAGKIIDENLPTNKPNDGDTPPNDGDTPPNDGDTSTSPTDGGTTNVFNNGDKSLNTGVGGLLTGEKEKVESGLGGLWADMQKPGYWSTKIKGGAGDWDNRLFRLGEMMSYMGTPLSKREKNPAERWTSSAAAVSKANTAGTKATKELRDRMTKIIPNKETLIRMFLTKKPGIIKDGKPGTTEYALAAKQAAAYAEVGHQLIMENPPIEPTVANIKKRLAELAEAKNKKNKEKK